MPKKNNDAKQWNDETPSQTQDTQRLEVTLPSIEQEQILFDEEINDLLFKSVIEFRVVTFGRDKELAQHSEAFNKNLNDSLKSIFTKRNYSKDKCHRLKAEFRTVFTKMTNNVKYNKEWMIRLNLENIRSYTFFKKLIYRPMSQETWDINRSFRVKNKLVNSTFLESFKEMDRYHGDIYLKELSRDATTSDKLDLMITALCTASIATRILNILFKHLNIYVNPFITFGLSILLYNPILQFVQRSNYAYDNLPEGYRQGLMIDLCHYLIPTKVRNQSREYKAYEPVETETSSSSISPTDAKLESKNSDIQIHYHEEQDEEGVEESKALIPKLKIKRTGTSNSKKAKDTIYPSITLEFVRLNLSYINQDPKVLLIYIDMLGPSIFRLYENDRPWHNSFIFFSTRSLRKFRADEAVIEHFREIARDGNIVRSENQRGMIPLTEQQGKEFPSLETSKEEIIPRLKIKSLSNQTFSGGKFSQWRIPCHARKGTSNKGKEYTFYEAWAPQKTH